MKTHRYRGDLYVAKYRNLAAVGPSRAEARSLLITMIWG